MKAARGWSRCCIVWGSNITSPDVIPRKLDIEKQKAFIEEPNNLLNSLPDNEAVLFVDAVTLLRNGGHLC